MTSPSGYMCVTLDAGKTKSRKTKSLLWPVAGENAASAQAAAAVKEVVRGHVPPTLAALAPLCFAGKGTWGGRGRT